MELIGMQIYSNLTEKAKFFMKFVEFPTQIGSITPSSRFLAQKMLAPIDWESVRFVAELGAGTGAFTKHIQLLKHPTCKVAVFEKDNDLRDELHTLYPELSYFKEAIQLSEKTQIVGMDSLDAVISGLPFTLFTEAVRNRIIDEVINSLKPNGILIAFQYSLQMKKLLLRKFSQVEISFVPLNLPPAFVYVCHK